MTRSERLIWGNLVHLGVDEDYATKLVRASRSDDVLWVLLVTAADDPESIKWDALSTLLEGIGHAPPHRAPN